MKKLYAVVVQEPGDNEEVIYVWASDEEQAAQQVMEPRRQGQVVVAIDLLVEASPLHKGQRDGYSLLPLDVGFDLRATGTPVAIPEDASTLGISCMLDDDPYVLRGSSGAIAIALREAGYNVA